MSISHKTITNIAVSSSIALGLTLASVVVSTSAEAACVTGVASHDVLNMRSRATSRSSIVRAIPPGACGVGLTGRYKGNWGRVRYRGTTGWVNMRYIDEGGDGDVSPAPATYCVRSPGDGFLNFRSRPSARSQIVGSANHNWCGMRLLRCSSSGRWCKMRTHEFDGWVNMRYARRR